MVDASRAVGVVSNLLSPTEKARVQAATRDEYVKVREQYARGQSAKDRSPIGKARDNAFKADFAGSPPPRPSFLGVRPIEYDLGELVPYIDWSPFFASWELVGRFPQILEDEIVGEAARDLYRDARAMLDRIVAEKWFTAKGVVGFWPANADGDDIVVWADEGRTTEEARLHTLRQQMVKKRAGQANAALSDFIAPAGTEDWIGGFAVTSGHGELEVAARFKAAGDDYNAILSTALADRLAEAFAEALHRKVRMELWGFSPDEPMDVERLIGEDYRGIRPAPGYPAQPDHTEKATLFRLLNATQHAGIELTESFAMNPPAAVSGLYFSHPDSHYFGVGKIDRDQVADYAARKGWDLATAERWLSPILAYTLGEPERGEDVSRG